MSDQPLGIFDSGVGGLTVTREIVKVLPGENIIYFGDTLHRPYGSKSLKNIRYYTEYIARYLLEERGCKALIIACNIASIAGQKTVENKYSRPIMGPVEAGVREAMKMTRNNRVGVVATSGTAESGVYQKLMSSMNGQVQVFAKGAPCFVSFVENGVFTGKAVQAAAEKYLGSFKGTEIDTLILGCTHFPYLQEVIQKVVGPDINLIFPGLTMALDLKATLSQKGLLRESTKAGDREFLVSDLKSLFPGFIKYGEKFLGMGSLFFKEESIY